MTIAKDLEIFKKKIIATLFIVYLKILLYVYKMITNIRKAEKKLIELYIQLNFSLNWVRIKYKENDLIVLRIYYIVVRLNISSIFFFLNVRTS